MSLRLVGYIRVSTDDQARGGVSLPDQRARIEAYAIAHEHVLLQVFSDEGISGRTAPEDRPGLAAALAKVRAREADGLVVLAIDRLSRKSINTLRLAAEARDAGWHLLSVNDHIDTTSSFGRFLLSIMASMAEMESDRTGERVTAGMRQLVTMRRVTSFHTPFGYRMPDGSTHPRRRPRDAQENKTGDADRRPLVPFDEEMRLLDVMLQLHDTGHTTSQIAQFLRQNCEKNPRTGKPFVKSTLQKIINTAVKYREILEPAS